MPLLDRFGWRPAVVGSLLALSTVLAMPPLLARPIEGAARPSITFFADRTGRTPVQDDLTAAATRAVSKNRTLLVPKGNYLFAGRATLPVGAHVQLAAGARLQGALPGASLLQMNRGSTLSGGVISNNAGTDAFDIDIVSGARSVNVSGVRFGGAHTNAIYIDNPGIRKLTITGCTFVGVVYGVLLNPGAIDASGVRVTNNTFTRIAADAVEINAETNGSASRVRDVTVSGNTVMNGTGGGPNGGFGVGLAGVDHFTISGNHLIGVRNEAIHLEDHSSHGVVRQNLITGGGGGYRPAIAVYRTTDRVVIKNNRIERFAGDGISVLWDPYGSSTNIQVVSNAINAVKASGITVSGGRGTGPFEIEKNVVYNAGGSPIAVLGSHHFSSVTANVVVASSGGSAIFTKYRGSGLRVYTANRVERTPSASFSRSASRLSAGLVSK